MKFSFVTLACLLTGALALPATADLANREAVANLDATAIAKRDATAVAEVKSKASSIISLATTLDSSVLAAKAAGTVDDIIPDVKAGLEEILTDLTAITAALAKLDLTTILFTLGTLLRQVISLVNKLLGDITGLSGLLTTVGTIVTNIVIAVAKIVTSLLGGLGGGSA